MRQELEPHMNRLDFNPYADEDLPVSSDEESIQEVNATVFVRFYNSDNSDDPDVPENDN